MNIYFLIILIFGGILLNSNYGTVSAAKKKSSTDLVIISLENPADVYLVSQVVAIFYAISKCISGQSIIPITPIGYVANYLFIANCNCSHIDDEILVFNKITGRLICIISKKELFRVINKYQEEINDVDEINISTFFIELLSINNKKTSQSTKNLYQISGNIIAELLGFGPYKPSILFNLNGLLPYSTALPKRDCMIPKTTLIKHFMEFTNPIALSTNLTGMSVLIDGATAFNDLYVFHDSSSPRRTCSGLMASHLIGDKRLLKQTLVDITALVNTLPGIKRDKLAVYILYLLAIDEPFKYSTQNILSDLYADQHSGCIDDKTIKRYDGDEHRRKIEEPTTTTTTTQATTTISIPSFWNTVNENNPKR